MAGNHASGLFLYDERRSAFFLMLLQNILGGMWLRTTEQEQRYKGIGDPSESIICDVA